MTRPPTATSSNERTRRPQSGLSDEQRGNLLEVLASLLHERRDEAVIELVAKLLARNTELERRLAELLSPRRSRETVSKQQLRLLLDELSSSVDDQDQRGEEETDDGRREANEDLRATSGIDEAGPAREVTPKRKQPALRRPIPDHLRRVDNPLQVPVEERPCPVCGAERTCIGHDITEVIEFVPAKVFVRRDVREKLACAACEGNLARGPVGDKVVAGGRLGPSLVAELLIDKYDDGIPLHRQQRRFERLGLSLPVSTLADQVRWSAELLQPVARACLDAVLAAPVMHLDATGLPVLAHDRKDGVKLGALWGLVGGDTAAYVYNATGKKRGQRPGELGPEELLARRSGYTVADASRLFDASFERPELIECGCNMHARRYFKKALDRGDKRAALPLAAFKKLYEVERELRDADAMARLAARQARSKPVYESLVKWCLAHQPYEPPKSPMGQAIGYLLNHREALTRFMEDGRIPPDNGAVERLHVRTALTRKNYLFAGSDTGGERAAVVYTIFGSCRLAEVNPREYLADVFPRLARGVRLRDVAQLIPARWRVTRASSEPSRPA